MKLAHRCWKPTRLVVAIATFFLITTIVFAESSDLTQLVRAHEDLEVKGKHLRAEFVAAYNELRAKKALARENDISPIILKYVSPSMSIEHIRHVLRSAGFGEPGITVNGHLFFSMKVGGFLSFENVAVDIAPQFPGDFHVIQTVTGALFSVDL